MVEAGLGHVEGQYDAASYFLGSGSGERPVLMTLDEDGFTAGAGLAIEVIFAPRTIPEIVAGHWGFNRPENEPGPPDTPDLPDVFVGGGSRVGI